MKTRQLFFVFILVIVINIPVRSQSHFFRQYWAEYSNTINNFNYSDTEVRPRVGDRGMSTDTIFWARSEAQVNGLIMINIPDDIKNFEHAELYLELWGGHPGTSGKRFQMNGGKVYVIPDKYTTEKNCEYLYPLIPVDYTELVTGNNAIQFGCDRGSTFWGHYMIDQLAMRCYLKADNPDLIASGLDEFRAAPVIKQKVLSNEVTITLEYNDLFSTEIVAVHYFGRYLGYDNKGSGIENDWQGYTHDRKYVMNIGTSTQRPFMVVWETKMIPDQPGPMAVKALIEFKNGIFCWSDKIDGLTFPLNRNHVKRYYCNELPKPFWSRDNKLKEAKIELPFATSEIESAELHIRIWDGGEGDIKEPFKFNGVPYKITSGRAVHDMIYTINMIDPKSLKQGMNEIQLLSDTKHHGIEVCWPGPALVIRYK